MARYKVYKLIKSDMSTMNEITIPLSKKEITLSSTPGVDT